MKVTRGQFVLLSLLTLTSILWLLLLTCYRENWGFWQSPEVYELLKKEYPEWFREYILSYYDITLFATVLVYTAWMLLGFQRFGESRVVKVAIVLMTLFMGITLGVLGANNIIIFLDSGELHGNTHLQTRP